MTKIADLPTFDMAEHLKTDEDVAAYPWCWKKTTPQSWPTLWV